MSDFQVSDAIPYLALAIYALVDKVVVPLLKGKDEPKPAVTREEWRVRCESDRRELDALISRIAAVERTSSNIRSSVQSARESLAQLKGLLETIKWKES